MNSNASGTRFTNGFPFYHYACLFLFLLSGAAGLIYEVLWVRQFSIVFGASTFAVTMVLTAYMTGIGLGSWLVGRMTDALNEKQLGWVYILLELGIGLYSLMLPILLQIAAKTYIAVFHLSAPNPLMQNGIRLLLAISLLMIPTLLMGATLPVLSRYIIRRKHQISLTVSQLYTVNTLGAIFGTIGTGYFFLPCWGIMFTTLFAVALNFLVAFGFWYIAFVHPIRHPERQASELKHFLLASDSASYPTTALQKAIIAGFGLSGAAAMIYEVAWTRTLCMILGTTTYAFSTMLAAFLLGIALGSWVYRVIPGSFSRIKLFIIFQLVIGFSVLFTIPCFEKLPFVFLSLHGRWVNSWGDLQFLRFFLSVMVMLLPTFAMGILFPVISAVFVESTRHLGKRIGRVYAVNTFGAAVGTILGGLFLIPAVGMEKTIIIGAMVNVLAGTGVYLLQSDAHPLRRAAAAMGIAAAVLLVVGMTASWAPKIINSGTYIYASRYEEMLADYQEAAKTKDHLPELNAWEIWELAMDQYELLYYRSGIVATVAVMERDDGVRFLTINGKTDASTGMQGDMRTQTMIGHLPLLFHDHPDDIMIVGLGSGITAGSVLTHPVRSVDCIEISPSVIEASRYFADFNHHIRKDDRLRIIPKDARNILLTSDKHYDVIISQPSNPWISGESSLFSREWYRLIHKHLNSGGIFLQWVPSYLMEERDLKIIMHTLRSVFPNLSVWTSGSEGDLVLMAKKGQPLKIDIKKFLAKLERPGIRKDIARVSLDAESIPFRLFLMSEDSLAYYLYADLDRPLRMNTDDHLIIEFSTPKHLVHQSPISSAVDLSRIRPDPREVLEIFKNMDEADLNHISRKDISI